MKNTTLASLVLLLAKLAIISLFLPAGISKLMNFQGTVGYISSMGMPVPTLSAIGAILVEVVGSILLLIGFRQVIVAALMIIFTLIATFVFHAYWQAAPDAQMIQSLLFYKNIAICGGLLAVMVASTHANQFTVDGWLNRKKS